MKKCGHDDDDDEYFLYIYNSGLNLWERAYFQ